jgi:hypothetical protein
LAAQGKTAHSLANASSFCIRILYLLQIIFSGIENPHIPRDVFDGASELSDKKWRYAQKMTGRFWKRRMMVATLTQ